MSHPAFTDIGACVFDAYGTLFDVHSAAEREGALLGVDLAPLSALWRQKQLEYSWLRSLMGRHADFAQVTADALLDAALAHVLVERLETLRNAGPDGESLPLLMDDPFRNVRSDAKPILLEQLVRASANQQVVYLTEDADVISWARLEAVSGQLSVVEPSVSRSRAEAGSGYSTRA